MVGRRVTHESSPLNEQGLTSAAGLGDVSAGALGHVQSGKDLREEAELINKKEHRNITWQRHSMAATD